MVITPSHVTYLEGYPRGLPRATVFFGILFGYMFIFLLEDQSELLVVCDWASVNSVHCLTAVDYFIKMIYLHLKYYQYAYDSFS